MMSLFLMGAAMAASAVQPAPANPQAAQADALRDNRTICRREDQIGTRLAPRICLTRAQWRDRDIEARRVAREGMDENARAGANRTTRAGGD